MDCVVDQFNRKITITTNNNLISTQKGDLIII
jgi:hypothetical protein